MPQTAPNAPVSTAEQFADARPVATADLYSVYHSYPKMVVLTFVYPCNASCPHCPYENSNIRDEYRDVPFMPDKLFRQIADESGPHNALIRVSGAGEPMLHPNATELIVHAKRQGNRIGLITNGSKFTESNTRALLEAEVDMIEFSVDACDQHTYENVVRPRLKWDVLLANVKRMLEMRDKLGVSSKIVASGVNQTCVDIDAVETFWRREMGVDNFIKRKFLTWGDSTSLDPSRSADPTPYLDTTLEPCPFIFERVLIDTRGNVMGCPYDIDGQSIMGNLYKNSMTEIWQNDKFEHYRSKHMACKGHEIALCSKCPDWKYRSWTHNYWKVMKDAEAARTGRSAARVES